MHHFRTELQNFTKVLRALPAEIDFYEHVSESGAKFQWIISGRRETIHIQNIELTDEDWEPRYEDLTSQRELLQILIQEVHADSIGMDDYDEVNYLYDVKLDFDNIVSQAFIKLESLA